MSVRVEVEDGEPIRKAMTRLKKSIRYQLGWKAVVFRPPFHFVPQNQIRRKKAWQKLKMAQRETWQGKRQERY